MDPIQVDTTVPVEPDLISVDLGQAAPAPLPQPTIDLRANKAAFGLSPMKTLEELRNSIASGGEDQVRQDAAAQLDNKKQQQLQQVIAEVSRRKGGPLTSQELQGVSDLIERNNKFTDPKSVFEEEFTKRYISAMYKRDPNSISESWVDDAKREIPQHIQTALDLTNNYAVKDEFLRAKLEDLESEAQSQSWPGYLADKSKNLLTMGLYDEIKLRGNVPKEGVDLGIGTNVERQRIALYQLPFDQFKDKVTEIADRIKKDNPSLALEFLSSMLGKSSSDILAGNLSTIATAVTFPGVGTIGKKLLMGRANKAAVDMLGSTEDLGFPIGRRFSPGARAEDLGFPKGQPLTETEIRAIQAKGTGNLAESGILKSTSDVIGDISGTSNPGKQAIEALPKTLRLQADEIRANPGIEGQEVANRLAEAYTQSGTDILNVIANRMAVERIPAPIATEQGVRLIQENIKNKFPGLSNRLLGTGDPIILYREPLSTVHFVEMQVGDEGATLFKRRSTAVAFANAQGIVLKGAESAPRQLELQRLLAINEGQLGYSRKALVEFPDKLNKLIRMAEGQAPTFELNAKDTRFDQATREHYLGQAKGLRAGIVRYKDELNAGTKNVETNITKLETEHLALNKELAGLRSSHGAEIAQQGEGFYISKWVPVNESDPVLQSLLFTTEASKTPKNIVSDYLTWLITPDETFSLNARQNAKVVSYSQSPILEALEKETREISKLAKWTFPGSSKKQRWEDFRKVLKYDQSYREADKMGHSFKGPGDLEDFYMRTFQRMPIEAETNAYFAFKKFLELDAIHRDLQVYKNKSINGVESHSFNLVNRYGKKIWSEPIDGVTRKDFPGGESTVMVIGRDVRDNIQLFNTHSMPRKIRDELTETVKNGGMKVVEVFDPEVRALQRDPAFSKVLSPDDRVHYVISKNVETKPLSFNQVTRQAGGHFDYEFEHAIKQANMRFDRTTLKNFYEGDTLAVLMQNRATSGIVAKRMNIVRELIRDGKEAAAELAAKDLPFNWETHRSWYEESRGPEGALIPARFSKTEPFFVVPKGKMIIDNGENALASRFVDKSGKSTFKDGTKQGSLARQFQVQYTGQRDAYDVMTVNDVGSRNKPIFTYDPATLVDPIPSMTRATQRIVNSSFMDDYKLFAIRHWIQEAKDHLVGDAEDILHAPFHFFYKGEFKTGTPLEIQSRLQAARFKAQQIMGTPSTLDTFLHSISQRLADAVYTHIGPTKLDPSWLLPKITDAAAFTRAATYHVTTSLFSPVQILVQSMSYATILGLEGVVRAGQGTTGGFLHQMERLMSLTKIDPVKRLDFLDKIASKSGFKPGEWKEARDLLFKTGFHIVGGEHILSELPMSSSIMKSGGREVLDLGTMFMKGSDRNIRFAAWYTAYKKFRDLNPIGRPTETDLKDIFENAELLTGNMSQASKSFLQRGPLAFASQFLAWNLRTAELFLGSRITGAQRIRMLATYGTLFGVSAFNLFGVPVGDMTRKFMINHDYLADEQGISNWLAEGLPSAMLKLATGNRYNIGSRLGATGLDPIRDIMVGDKSMWTMMAGATGNVMSNVWEQSSGFRSAMMSLMQDKEDHFPLRAEDFYNPIKVVSTWNNAERYIVALNTTNWVSRKGQTLTGDITPWNALFMSLSGLQPQSVSDIRNMTISEEDKKNVQKKTEDEFLVQFNKYTQAIRDNSPEQAQDYGKRARSILIMGGYPLEKYSSLITRATKGNESLINRMDINFYTRNIAPAERENKLNTLIRKKQLQGTP